MSVPALAIIGGSGLYDMPDLAGVQRIEIDTPFGSPSDLVTVGMLAGLPVAFLPRHGRSHQHSPSRIPVRANIWALRSLGARRLLSVSAVGSLREHIQPLDLAVPDQLFDRTVGRERTFFGDSVAHVSFAEPFCPALRPALVRAAGESNATVHDGGTYICIEGPQFSTKAESRIYRSWGLDIIGMTALPEARLAREAGLCYATLALVTDYDVWHESEADVSVATVISNLRQNVRVAQAVIRSLVPALQDLDACTCGAALTNAVITAPQGMSATERERLEFLLGTREP